MQYYHRIKIAVIGIIMLVFSHNNSYGNGVLFNILMMIPAEIGDTLEFNTNYYKSIEKSRPSNPENPTTTPTITYDNNTKLYKIQEGYINNPKYLTFEEYSISTIDGDEYKYFQQLSRTKDDVERKRTAPPLYDGPELYDRLFGGSKIDIKPQGTVEVTLGVNSNKLDNPVLPVSQRKQTNFDFDMNIQMNVTGQIGDKLKLNTNFNTKAAFNFENQVKLGYKGKEDDIIQEISAGNVSLPLRGSLIRGNQSLFGVKTQLKFGRLTMTNILAQQKSSSESIRIENGAQQKKFEIKADEYDDYRNYFFAQYFRDNYEPALSKLPVIQSLVYINRLEVWVTNKTRQTEDVREVVALTDLGENRADRLHNLALANPATGTYPNNNSNSLYGIITNDANNDKLRDPIQVVNLLGNTLGLQPVDDFERTSARKLQPSEYTFNPQLGYLSLNQALKPDEVLGIAIEYTVNGKVYKLGELSGDLPPHTDTTDVKIKDQVLVLKMLKGTSVRTRQPIWDLMMKNIYSLNSYQVSPDNFILDVYYKDPGGGNKRYLPDGGDIAGQQLIKVLRLDALNNQRDPQPDGRFDFVEGITINSKNGKIIFPVLEPFGDYLKRAINDEVKDDPYIYQMLYDSTKFNAQQFPEQNRYLIKGSFKSSLGSEIRLNAFNLPQGSVKVNAGGQQLVENVDYEVNYGMGTIRIINEGILNSGVPIDVRFENNLLFGIINKSLIGTRLDYKINEKTNMGFTHMRLSEKPFSQKVNLGDDPIKNNIFGLDFNYGTESKGLTRIFNKVTAQDTKTPSKITTYGEAAYLKPGHNKNINIDNQGTVYIDDFEGSSVVYDLRIPYTAWSLSSAPKGMTNYDGTPMFPEASLNDSLLYGYNRAKLSWYQIDNTFYNKQNNPLDGNLTEQEGIYTRRYLEKQVFPNRQNQNLQNAPLFTFDLSYNPYERGPYNYDAQGVSGISAGVDANGKLKDPASRWGGIMRNIESNDFEAANIEAIQFWVLDPFMKSSGNKQGKVYLQLGTISEDILRDGRKQYENGLPRPGGTQRIDSSSWGYTPSVFNAITNSFDADPEVVKKQDVGLDGMDDEIERRYYKEYLEDLQTIVTNAAYTNAIADPSSDNYRYILDGSFSNSEGIIQRYRNFNGTQGNSSNDANSNFTNGNSKNTPDDEDLNRDNSLNETEEYFQYSLSFDPQSLASSPYIVDRVVVRDITVNGVPDSAVWYQVRIPIEDYEQRVGGIPDFRSIRFIRMLATEFEEPVVLRFAEFGLLRNQWRRYLYNINETTPGIIDDDIDRVTFTVRSVSVEENTQRYPVPYAIPPGITREQNISSYINALQNEQSLSLQVCALPDGAARAIYKLGTLNLRNFKRIKLFSHAESMIDGGGENYPIKDGDLTLFMRLGADFTENYYEYEIPLKVTLPGNYNPENENDKLIIWPAANNLEVPIDSLTLIKQLRNNADASLIIPYSIYDSISKKRITIKGNPDIGQSAMVMLGIRNPRRTYLTSEYDDGQPKCAEVWVNELRVAGFDEQGGWAALGRMDVQLGNLGNISVSGNMHTIGFGDLEQKIDQRYRDNYYQYNVAANLDLGKLLPENAGLQIPIHAGINQSVSTPQYDPYNLDTKIEDMYNNIDADLNLDAQQKQDKKNEIKDNAQDVVTITSVNVTNLQKNRTSSEKTARVYDVENLNLSYAYTQTDKHNPLVEQEKIQNHKFSLGYNFSPKVAPWTPFKDVKNNNKYLKPIKEFNVNWKPNTLSFRSDVNRQMAFQKIRDIGDDGLKIDPTFYKFFTWDRYYSYRHNLTKSISFDFTAINRSRIDEPYGFIDTKEKKDSIRKNFWSFGRNIGYEHNFNVSYSVPTQLFPFLDWLTIRTRYGSTLSWQASSLAFTDWGNLLQNSRNYQITGDVNFKTLYQKAKFLKPYTNTQPKTEKDKYGELLGKYKENVKKGEDKLSDIRSKYDLKLKEIENAKADTSLTKADIDKLIVQKKELKNQIRKQKEDIRKIVAPSNPKMDGLARALMMVQRINLSYDDRGTTSLPGFMPSPNMFGQSFSYKAPGPGFLFGAQKDTFWLNEIAQKGWITQDTIFNSQFQQTRTKNMSLKIQIEPLRDMRLDVSFTKTQTENYSEFFKRNAPDAPFSHNNPNTGGNFTVSFAMFRTLFQKLDQNNFHEAFRRFENIRTDYSQLFGNGNPNVDGRPFVNEDSLILNNYAFGYGPYAQDVLIPSLLAAYTGKSIDRIKLNPLKQRPLPNWRLTYGGLAKTEWGKKVFNSFNLTHGYTSTFSIGNYSTNLNYIGTPGTEGGVSYFVPSALDTLSNNYYQLYYIPQITISEQFQPLIGIDMTFKNTLTTSFNYKKSRTVGLSMLDFQLSETRSTEISASLGYTLANFKLPFKIKGKKIILDNNVNLRCDFSLRNDKSINYKLQQEIAEPTRGSKTISLSPTIDYIVNKKLNLRIFYDFRKTVPATLQSYPQTTSRGGITLRFTLAP